MNDKELLSIVTDTEFRAQSLEQTLRGVRRRRRVRRCGQALAIVALLTAALWWSVPRRATLDAPVAAGPEVIRTGPTSVEIVSSRASSFEFVGDEDLLKLVPGETKLLVWHAPNQAELVILDGTQ